MKSPETQHPELWSDFDGTAVGTKSKVDPRNWLKYPLPLAEGYPEFLEGFRQSGGVIGGVVSRRPNIGPRRFVTNRSIERLGLNRFFDPGNIALLGSEEKKAEYVIDRAREQRVGLIDDKPHRVGQHVLEVLRYLDKDPMLHLTIGAVNNDRQDEYIERFMGFAAQLGSNINTMPERQGYEVEVRNSRVDIVRLEPYSYIGGMAFAGRLGVEDS